MEECYFFHGYFSRFLNCANDTKSLKAYQIIQQTPAYQTATITIWEMETGNDTGLISYIYKTAFIG